MIRAMLKIIDIGANLTDPMFKGFYNGSQKHPADLNNVLERSWKNGVDKIIVTAGSLDDITATSELCNMYDQLYRTVGCHPTKCEEIEKVGEEHYFDMLQRYIEADINKNNNIIKNNNLNNNSESNEVISNYEIKNKIVAIGECGLDYERLQFCPKEIQLKYLPQHFHLAELFQLPLFLHCRASHEDLITILKNYSNLSGVVHSFDGSLEHAQEFIKHGFFIGINGCSLRTEENLKVVENLPLEKLLVETDAPWCEIKPTHPSFKHVTSKNTTVKKEKWKDDCMVKGRNEPCNVKQVVEVLASLKQKEIQNVANEIYQNTIKLFRF